MSVTGAQFTVNGERIYFNGVNTPWDHWNDFGGASGWNNFDVDFWDQEFAKLAAAGINSCRVWITCNGENDGFVYDNGRVTGMTEQFWQDCDALLELANTHGIYIMASLLSFDHAKDEFAYHHLWRDVFSDADAAQACIDHFILPFVDRYKDDPALYAVDLCNEIEWIHESSDMGQLPWTGLQQFVAMAAAAIHRSESPVLVTMGTASVKWNSDVFDGNYWSDAALQSVVNDPEAFLDFYQLHYYDWMHPWFGAPNHDRSVADYQLTDRPVVVGEMPIDPIHFGGDGVSMTLAESYEFMLAAGYQGHYPWSSNAVGGASHGDFSGMNQAAEDFANNHADLMRPQAPTGGRVIRLTKITGYDWFEASGAGDVNEDGSGSYGDSDSEQEVVFSDLRTDQSYRFQLQLSDVNVNN